MLLTAEVDTYVDSANPTTEYSGVDTLNIAYTASSAHIQSTYISFDATSIATTATIESAVLYVYVISADLTSYGLKKIDNTWAETITYNSKPDSSGYIFIASLDSPTAGTYNGVSIKDTVAAWVLAPSTNKGIYFYKTTTGGDGGMEILSTEGTYKPQLLITYTN